MSSVRINWSATMYMVSVSARRWWVKRWMMPLSDCWSQHWNRICCAQQAEGGWGGYCGLRRKPAPASVGGSSRTETRDGGWPGFCQWLQDLLSRCAGQSDSSWNCLSSSSRNRKSEATAAIQRMVKMYQVEAMAVGNGTASRETSDWLHSIDFVHPVDIYVVSEDGASIYSASKIARDEFPDEDVTCVVLWASDEDWWIRLLSWWRLIRRASVGTVSAWCGPDSVEEESGYGGKWVAWTRWVSTWIPHRSICWPMWAVWDLRLPRISWNIAARMEPSLPCPVEEGATSGSFGLWAVCRLPPHSRR